MRNLESLSQFIVPLVFLAIWALTSILNQEGKPLPRRPGSEPEPSLDPEPDLAGRPMVEPARPDPGAAARAAEAAASRAAVGGGRAAPKRIGTARPPGRSTDAEIYVMGDEMVFVDPTTHRRIGSATVPPHPKPTSATPRRKPSRNRRAERPAPAADRREPEPRRALSEQIGQAMTRNRDRALPDLAPLASGLNNLTATPLPATVAAHPGPVETPPALSAADVRRMIAEPGRLREMAVLVELLGPPISRRPPRRF